MQPLARNTSPAELARRYTAGETIMALAEQTGLAHNTVRRRLSLAGAWIRPLGFRGDLAKCLMQFDRLDALSRDRALTHEESLTLEMVQDRLLQSRAYGLRKELVRRGIVRGRGA